MQRTAHEGDLGAANLASTGVRNRDAVTRATAGEEVTMEQRVR
jgi:hypothetical protein